jgi:hypothetical protein
MQSQLSLLGIAQNAVSTKLQVLMNAPPNSKLPQQRQIWPTRRQLQAPQIPKAHLKLLSDRSDMIAQQVGNWDNAQ